MVHDRLHICYNYITSQIMDQLNPKYIIGKVSCFSKRIPIKILEWFCDHLPTLGDKKSYLPSNYKVLEYFLSWAQNKWLWNSSRILIEKSLLTTPNKSIKTSIVIKVTLWPFFSTVQKSENLQYNTLVCWFAGTKDSSTKRLMFQALFYNFL